MKLTFGTLKVTAVVLLIQAILNGISVSSGPLIYGPFAALDLVLAYGVYVENRNAVKVSLVYLGLDLFLAIFYLIAGVIPKGVVALLDFLAIHDMVSYIEAVAGEDAGETGDVSV
ncbi:hypothetical protein [Thermococcus waiotapuensis]|uniref:Uncharacterized protein n=1 Tax=Thermococcus waiotapuensis TaxID=90909 RepID=A0AAE4NUW7_9EURY|nr:hypothetical protein [Thermococcus waiotapuensis]MDV3103564.1 hypothetical protein [Thermococcus waiotapuensis]